MIVKLKLLVLSVCVQSAVFGQVKVGDIFPAWSEGYMDIHHVNTGRGECVFAILPDGTTMLIDAGEIGPSPRVSDARPDDSKSTGEWITRYITRIMQPKLEQEIDYILLTHFHKDHMEDAQLAREKSKKGDYQLSGITEVGDRLPFKKIVDRNWPNYNWPVPLTDNKNMQNYINFVNSHIANGATAEQFEVGSNKQFKLLRNAKKYPEFEIRNLAANGYVWTGVNDQIHNHFPLLETLDTDDFPGENHCSAAIRISYGKFDYYNGGDIVNTSTNGMRKDIETAVGLVTGPVEVCLANHHADHDAMGEAFLKAVRPRVVIMQTWCAGHPDHRVFQRLLDKTVHPGERDIFATNLMDATRIVLGSRINQLKSQQGHIVIRVHPGGDHFHVYILDDSMETFAINAIHGPYESR